MNDSLKQQLNAQQQASRALRLQKEKRNREIKTTLVNIASNQGITYG